MGLRKRMFRKCLTDYFPRDGLPWGHAPINEAPAKTFLKETVEVVDAVNHCARTFTKKKNGEFTKDSADSYQNVAISAFGLMMSHFERFQRYQFAELLNTMDFMDCVDDAQLAKELQKQGCELSLQRLLSGRGDPREPGQIVADAMPGWHNPERVNRYFSVIFPKVAFYSKETVRELDLMWQLRHSIVHTAGVITREDAAKIPQLHGYADRRISLGTDFVPAVARRFHIMLKHSVGRLREEAKFSMEAAGVEEEIEAFLDSVVGIDSPRRSWLS
nr:hypothetical protein [Halomonas sp. 1513]